MSTAENATITLHIISDSKGTTARGVVNSAAVQFSNTGIKLSVLEAVKDMEQARAYLDAYVVDAEKTAVFHTLLDNELRRQLRKELEARGITSVDLLGPVMQMIFMLTQEEPLNIPGLVVDREAVETDVVDAATLV